MSVLVDFLVHEHEGGLDVVAEQHLTLFREMADRLCAEFNGIPPEELVPIEDENIKVPSVTKQRLADDVLIAVEQGLLKIAHSQAPSHRPCRPLRGVEFCPALDE